MCAISTQLANQLSKVPVMQIFNMQCIPRRGRYRIFTSTVEQSIISIMLVCHITSQTNSFNNWFPFTLCINPLHFISTIYARPMYIVHTCVSHSCTCRLKISLNIYTTIMTTPFELQLPFHFPQQSTYVSLPEQ